ncbi:MAG: hypothetical protein PHP82_02830 [Candidatus ainarchaeum sp.]|nr:hypothetical protein [Candidatus ainarchaeum sp.]
MSWIERNFWEIIQSGWIVLGVIFAVLSDWLLGFWSIELFVVSFFVWGLVLVLFSLATPSNSFINHFLETRKKKYLANLSVVGITIILFCGQFFLWATGYYSQDILWAKLNLVLFIFTMCGGFFFVKNYLDLHQSDGKPTIKDKHSFRIPVVFLGISIIFLGYELLFLILG